MANLSVTANFAINTYNLTITKVLDGIPSTIPPTGTYEYGAVVNLTAGVEDGYMFTGWTNGVRSIANSVTVTINGDMTITENYVSLNKVQCYVQRRKTGFPTQGTYLSRKFEWR